MSKPSTKFCAQHSDDLPSPAPLKATDNGYNNNKNNNNLNYNHNNNNNKNKNKLHLREMHEKHANNVRRVFHRLSPSNSLHSNQL